jgi:uncharacterized phage infection (PIP) family protein YhgE
MDILTTLLPELAQEYLGFFRTLREAQLDALSRKDFGAVRGLAETLTISMQGLSSLASLLNPPSSTVTIQTFDIAPLVDEITALRKDAGAADKLDQFHQQLTETKAALTDLQQKLVDEESQYTAELAEATKKLEDTQSALKETQDALASEESKFQQLADLLKGATESSSSGESAPEPGTPHPAQTTTTPAPTSATGDQPTPPAEPATGETLGVATGATSEVEPLE